MSIALLPSCASCESAGSRPPVRVEADAAASVAFGFDLYRAVRADLAGENIVISPASVGFALAMTMNGAEGPTRKAMAEVLRYPDANLALINRTDSILISRTNEPIERVEISVANALWARRGLDFKKDFLDRNARHYGAEVRKIDFNDPGAAGLINGWVASKTKDRITGIVDEIDPASILFLVNAIYFKGAWTKEFDPKDTKEDLFHLFDGGTVEIPMMHQSGEYPYFRGEGFQAASIPYGDGRTSMYVFLPDDREGLRAFNDSLTAKAWGSWMGAFASRTGRIALPRFTLEFKASLKRSLAALGMANAFDGSKANFRGMIEAADANVYIHDVLHKTYIAVSEEGTEAAAATSVEMRLTSVMEPQRPFEMICDHPFFIAIRDNETGLVLFMGSIVKPK
jgi:serpin B